MIQRTLSCCIRSFVERTALLLIALIVAQTWFVAGFPVWCRVQGGSMAETLLGDHIALECPECKFEFSCGADNFEFASSIVCPNCSRRIASDELKSTRPSVLAGDRVLIDRSAYLFRSPHRWDVVAFHRPGPQRDLTVKRVVGLPGERIEIRHGDIYADGQIQRKSLWQQKAVRILVHDANFTGTSPRWQEQDEAHAWTRQDGHWMHNESGGDTIQWLAYIHAQAKVDGAMRNETIPARVTDFNSYNQGRMQRAEDIHPMTDLAMSVRVAEIHGTGLIWLQATDGRDQFIVRIDPMAARYLVLGNGQPIQGASGKLPLALSGLPIEVSLFDRQFLLAIAGRTLVSIPLDENGQPSSASPAPTAEKPLAVGVQGLGVVLDRLKVYRDVYYARPAYLASSTAADEDRPGGNEYYVLGDNSPISEDSRTWTEGRFISVKSFVGKPLMVVYPAKKMMLGNWEIQVPELGKIRYIR